jgi:hypothetical protein
MARGGDIGLREFLDDTNTPGRPVASAVRHDLRLLWTALPPEELRRVVDVPRDDPHPVVDLRHTTARRPVGLTPDDLYRFVGVPQEALR